MNNNLDTQAVLDFPLTGIQLIEASAGTGKTYTIANLYLRHIIAGRGVAEVLVVTFTTAATDELRGRLRARLFETLQLLERGQAANDDDADEFLAALIARVRERQQTEQVIKRLRLAVRAMDEAAVYTIHSFCQRVLSEFAFNSGQQFQMEVLIDDKDLWRQAVQDWWRKTGYPLSPGQARLFRDSLEDLKAFSATLAPLLTLQDKQLLPAAGTLDAVLGRFDNLAPTWRALAPEWSEQGSQLKAILVDSNGLSRAQKSPYHQDALARAFAALDDWFASDQQLPPPAAFAVLTPQCMAAHPKKKVDPALGHDFFTRCGDIHRALLELQRDLRVAALADAASFTRGQVRQAKQQAQHLSFDDLLTEMRDALNKENGAALAAAVREQFPVAMIDEFQDTDPVQYAIFRQLYLGSMDDRAPDCGLIMIGDPKQAIYSFRGGDIFTYMQAREDVGQAGLHTLDTNWRSTPEVIGAVNAVFENRPMDAFVYGDSIPFLPAKAADKTHDYLEENGERQPALTLWTLPVAHDAKGEEKGVSKDNAREAVHAAVAGEIARLLQAGREGKALIGGKPLLPRDIAVLVRSAFEATDLRAVLAELGVNAVSVSRDSVFQTEEAGALSTLLRAVLSPRERELARLALTSPLLGKDYAEIARIAASEADWILWTDRLLALHQTWRHKGFMPMFQQLLREAGIAECLSRSALAERRLTNLLHLGELLQQASKVHTGMDALLTWYRRQREQSATEDADLRLESDADLVQIVTIHKSKGLEYPVVFVPYLWSCKPRDAAGLLAFHRGTTACLDAGSDDLQAHLCLAEQERLAEDLRLVYVALTRAESRLYLVWGRAGSRDGHAGQSALGYLLHPHQSAEALAEELPDAFAGLPDLSLDLEHLAQAANGAIALAPLPEMDAAPALPAEAEPRASRARPFTGTIATDWRISSFSALTRSLHAGPSPRRDQVADDVGMRFPAGSHVGSYLHLLLETLDFQGDIAAQVMDQSALLAERFGLDHARWGRDTATLLERVVRTKLNTQGLRLDQLAPGQRLNELEFDFATQSVDVDALNQLLAEHAAAPLQPLEIASFQGLVNGVIDLVFARPNHQTGRFYIADYKSNFLGGRFEDYAPRRLSAAVFERRYDLQYLLYTLALHRYLRWRQPGYDYARHFGGVYYLFLRGMRPETGPDCGVFFARPAEALINALDGRVFRHRIQAEIPSGETWAG